MSIEHAIKELYEGVKFIIAGAFVAGVVLGIVVILVVDFFK